MSESLEKFVIVGGGMAAGTLAAMLRRNGWAGEILLVSDEGRLPYHRPPLSKAYLTERLPDEQLLLRPAPEYEKNRIQLMLNSTAVGIDRAGRRLRVQAPAGIEEVGYDLLAVCTGARPRLLNVPGSGLKGVHYLRTAEDAAAIRQAAEQAGSAAVIGGGYIGLEIAASLRRLGLRVTVLEAMERLMQRVTSVELAAAFERIHTEEQVVVRTGAQVSALTGSGSVSGVECGGERLAAELVVVGIGILPNTELAERAGLATDNGIVVDESCRTEDERIFALGDCCTCPNAHFGRSLRLESVPNATGQARRIAALACGKPPPPQDLPWFWSDQYDIKLQIAGINPGPGKAKALIRGDGNSRSFSVWYLAGNTIMAADCVNQPQDFAAAKQLISRRIAVSPTQLTNPATDLKALLTGG